MKKIVNFPPNIEKMAFRNRSQYAWQKKDLRSVLDYCLEASIAISGGEAWVVRRVEECGPDEPTEKIHNLDPTRNFKGTVLARTKTHVVYGIIPSRNDQSIVLSWCIAERQSNQSWREYVTTTIQETIKIVEQGDLESKVIAGYSPYIYYNLVFKCEDNS